MRNGARAWVVAVALGGAVLVAIGLRFWDLATNPGGLYPDEAFEALSAHRLLTEPGYHPIFFPDGGGREALFAYLVAAAFHFLGESTLTIRAVAAALGVAAVPAVWLLGRRFGEATGLVAAGWVAGSLWLVAISRNGMRNVLVPVLGALVLVALVWWASRPTRWRACTSGAVTALAAFYTYQPLKLLPVLVIVWVLWVRHTDRATYLGLRRHAVAFAIAFAVVAAPMLAVAITDPTAYFGRALGVTPFGPGLQADASLPIHWLRTLGMFAVVGDPNPRHDVAALPALGWPVFLVAALGFAVLWRRRADAAHALILLSLPVFLLPPMIAVEGGSPHFLRSLGLAAPLAITVGLGTCEAVRLLQRRWRAVGIPVAVGVTVAGLVALAAGSATAYLARPVADRYDAYADDVVALAGLAGPSDVVILDDYRATVVRFLDAGRLPDIVAQGVRLPSTTARPAEQRVLALDIADLVAAVGVDGATRARPVARDPAGHPRVWLVVR